MKKLQLILLMLLFGTSIYAQSPEKMSYQAMLRDASDALLVNQGVGIQVSVLTSSNCSSGAVYVETHSVTTNANGLISLEIGMGTPVTGTFSGINWSGGGSFFLKTETDPTSLGGTSYTITSCSQLLSVPYALHAKTAASADNVPTYAVGDFAQGGVVFWVDGTGQHGLVCAKSDQSSGVRWHGGSNGNTFAGGNGIYAGELNTAIIIAVQAPGGDGSSFAAKICNELKITEGGISYADWYLPSIDELELMYNNRTLINTTATANGGGSFSTNRYWSSTETSSLSASNLDFNTGTIQDILKFFPGDSVRAIRAF